MRTAYAFLANAAEFSADDRLFVLGGDFDPIESARFPVAHPSMTLVFKLIVDPAERGRDQRVHLAFVDPDGQPVVPETSLKFSVEGEPQPPERLSGVGFTWQLQSVVFPRSGTYTFRIR